MKISHPSISTLAGNVSNMSATRQQCVKMLTNWVDMHVGANTKSTPTQEFCIGNHQQIVDTVVGTDTIICTYCSLYLPQW